MAPQQRLDRAARAEAILSDPLVVEALQALEADAIKAWRTTDARDVAGREMAWTLVKVVEQFTGRFERMLRDGKVARAEIERAAR